MLIRLSRAFSGAFGFTKPPTKSSFSNDLTSLCNPQNFTVPKLPHALKILDKLSSTFPSTISPEDPGESPKLLKGVQNFIPLIPSLTPDQISRLIKCLGKLSISDDVLWEALAKHLNRKLFSSLSPDNISTIIEAAARAKTTNEILWNTVECAILRKMYPDKQFNGEQITEVILAFNETERGGDELYMNIKPNLIAVMNQISSKNLIRLLQAFTKIDIKDPDLSNAFIERAIAIKDELTGARLQTIALALLKLDVDPTYIEVFKEEIVKKFATLNLANISAISFAYTRSYYNLNMESDILMKAIEQEISQNKEKLLKENTYPDPEGMVIKIMWSLAKCNRYKNLKLWKDFGNELRENTKLKNNILQPLLKEIRDTLRKCSVY